MSRQTPRYWHLYRWVGLPLLVMVRALVWVNEVLDKLQDGGDRHA
ncbi:hypothetical protein [Leptolyngbya sp. PL-A3]